MKNPISPLKFNLASVGTGRGNGYNMRLRFDQTNLGRLMLRHSRTEEGPDHQTSLLQKTYFHPTTRMDQRKRISTRFYGFRIVRSVK
jgi:hypothetical protein